MRSRAATDGPPRAPAARGRRPGAGNRRRRSGGGGPPQAPRLRSEGRLVALERPGVTERRSHREERRAECLEDPRPSSRRDAGPIRERRRRGRAEDVDVPPRELERRVCRVDVRGRHAPDHRRARTLPTDQNGSGRGRVPEPVGIHAERRGRVSIGMRAPPRTACSSAATSSATRRPLPSSGSRPSEKTACPALGTTYVLNRGPQSCTSDGSSQVDGLGAGHPGMDRQQRRPWHAVLQPRPRRATKRFRPGRQPLVERADPPPKRKDLLARERRAAQPSRPTRSARRRAQHQAPKTRWTSTRPGRQRVDVFSVVE